MVVGSRLNGHRVWARERLSQEPVDLDIGKAKEDLGLGLGLGVSVFAGLHLSATACKTCPTRTESVTEFRLGPVSRPKSENFK